MNVAIFGLGYVGTVSAACLADLGHRILGVDVQTQKVDLVNEGRSPIIEKDLDDLLARGVETGRLTATTEWRRAVAETDLAWLCVSTPSRDNGSLVTRYLERVCEQIGQAIPDRSDPYVVVVRSTALPGTTEDLLVPIIEKASGGRAGVELHVCYHPEYLREGSPVSDFRNPPKIVIGSDGGDGAELLASIYEPFEAELVHTSIRASEMCKYADNAWHALKISFANEIGVAAKRMGVDGRVVMDILCRDRQLNISEKYLRPGFAFGGSCLPKDLRAITHRVGRLDLGLPVLESVLASNERHIERAFRLVADAGHRQVGVLGLSFKPGTDDLRESPLVTLCERLIGKGYELRIFDHNVSLAKLIGANLEYIRRHIPHISRLMVETPEALLEHADTIILGNDDDRHREVIRRAGADTAVIDLVGFDESRNGRTEYHGICW